MRSYAGPALDAAGAAGRCCVEAARRIGGQLSLGLLLIPAGGAFAPASPGRLAAVALAVAIAAAAGLGGAVLARVKTSRAVTASGPPPARAFIGLAAGLTLLAIAVAAANRLAPGQAGWILLATGLIAMGLREPRPFAEIHLLWAVAPALLVGLGWAAAGGGGRLPGALLAWAVLGQLGRGLIWTAGEGINPRLLPWSSPTLGRMLELASPFALLGLIGPLGLGAAFLAGLAVAGLLVSLGQAWPAHTIAGRTASAAGAALSRLAIAAAVLLDRANWPS